ncbi:S8 family peptidase [Priestia aryabhattai]|uniref:S8 family peptidase n=1 Tax=Priestia aryabhattai TaxID=412384 RepID=UPI002E1DD07E|nr:S8 family peptidase [Priestia aryabhattai]
MNNSIRLYPIKKADINNKYSSNIIQVGAENKWKENITGKDVIISMIDTGVDDSHPSLIGKVIDGFNFTNDYQGDNSIYKDNNGHGTHVAGIMSGKFITNNNIVGVAPNSKILALKVLDKTGVGNVDSLIRAINYSIDWRGPNEEKVGVINISLGVKDDYPGLHESIKKAVQSQIPVVVAAGNSGDGNIFTNEYLYPGAYQEVIEVGAVDINNKISSFSNTNENIDIYAPGVEIVSSYINGGLKALSGTSMAAPHVTGAVALLIEKLTKENENVLEPKIFSELCKNTKPMHLENKGIEGCGFLYLN